MARPKKNQPPPIPHRRAIERAVEILGGVRALSRATSPTLTHTTIRNFLRLVDRPPRPSHAIAVENATEGRVDRMEFYPEILAGPLGHKIATFLREYAGEDPQIAGLMTELHARGIDI